MTGVFCFSSLLVLIYWPPHRIDLEPPQLVAPEPLVQPEVRLSL